MKATLIIAKKELVNYLTQPVGYVFAALLLLVANWLYFNDLFILGQADLSPLFLTIIFLDSIFVPAITMGLIADEKKNGNWEVLLSLPINEIQMVVGKFLGSAGFLVGIALLFLPTIATIYWLGSPETGMVVGGMLGVVLLGLAYLSVGILASCLTNSSVIAFLTTTIFLVINNFLGQSVLLDRMPGFLKTIFQGISLAGKTQKLGSGLISLNDLIFFGSWITVSLILSIIALKGRDK